MWGAAVVMPAAPCFFLECTNLPGLRFAAQKIQRALKKSAPDQFDLPALRSRRGRLYHAAGAFYAAGALGVRLRELRWKNSAWLATADTIAGWNGFEIRNAGSGRSPVRKRSG